MSLNAPTKMVFLISLVLAVLALLGAWVISIPVISGNAFLMMLLAYVVLAAGNILKECNVLFARKRATLPRFFLRHLRKSQ